MGRPDTGVPAVPARTRAAGGGPLHARRPRAPEIARPQGLERLSVSREPPAREIAAVLIVAGSGSAVSRCPPRCPASRGPARSPHSDSWVPKGLSPPRRAGCPPRAAPLPPAGPSAQAPARYLRWPPRSSSTWPRSPGAAPQPAPSALRRAPCWLPRRGPRRRGLGAITMY